MSKKIEQTEEKKTIDFFEVVDVCTQFMERPSPETQKALEDLQDKITVRAYVPMQEKVLILYKIIVDSDKSIELPASVFSIGLELACLFNGLLAYTNIDTDIPLQAKEYENYDVIYQAGLADYILQYCQRDYDKLVRLLERTISYENLLELLDTVTGVDTEAIATVLEEFKKFREELDPAMLSDMSDILRFNDPLMYKLKEDVVETALEQIERMDQLESLDLENIKIEKE